MERLTNVDTLIDSTWSASAPYVRRALRFIKKKGIVTPDELVAWDRDHGQQLFDWNDPSAAEEWRRHQARLFMNRFRGMFDGMRVRGFIRVREDADANIEQSGYVSSADISKHTGMRAQVIDDITRRMRMLASELRMWNLSSRERAAIIAQLEEAMAATEAA